VSDPPFCPGYRPQGRPGGSLTPRLSRSLSTGTASLIQPCNVGQISRADDVAMIGLVLALSLVTTLVLGNVAGRTRAIAWRAAVRGETPRQPCCDAAAPNTIMRKRLDASRLRSLRSPRMRP